MSNIDIDKMEIDTRPVLLGFFVVVVTAVVVGVGVEEAAIVRTFIQVIDSD